VRKSRFVAALVILLAALVAACSPSPRDVVPKSRDVRVQPGGDAGVNPEAYVYVARRTHGIVALAEARHMTDAEARAIVDRVANDMQECAQRLEAQGTLVEGAARIVAVASPNGTPLLNVRLAPGDAVAQNALLCLIAPVRAISFPRNASPNAPPGLAIEATWGPNRIPSNTEKPRFIEDAGIRNGT
jgi:hypothetical protein